MCVIACRVTICQPNQPSYAVAYRGFGVGELQDLWRKKLDPLGGEFGTGTRYRIEQVN